MLSRALPERLRELAEAKGGMASLARISGVNASSLSRCLKGAELSLSTAAAICEASGASLDWLTGNGSTLFEPVDQLQIPFYDVKASAGHGAIPNDKPELSRFVTIPRELLHSPSGRLSKQLCAILAQGDSMEPTIRSGSLLVVDRADSSIHEGIFVVNQNEVLLVKRVQPRDPRTIRLKSDNPQYEPSDIRLDDPSQNLKIFGRVIWTGHEL